MCKDHNDNYGDRESVLDNDADYQDWLDERERETIAHQMEMEENMEDMSRFVDKYQDA